MAARNSDGVGWGETYFALILGHSGGCAAMWILGCLTIVDRCG